jgi:hypothetical protein
MKNVFLIPIIVALFTMWVCLDVSYETQQNIIHSVQNSIESVVYFIVYYASQI